MAVSIRNEKYVKYMDSSEKAEIVAEIDVDSANELPNGNINGKILHQGSTALIIKEGRLAVLAGDGKWYVNGEAVS